MKKMIWLLILVVVGYLAYDRFYKKADSPEVAEVKALEARFEAAVEKFVRGHQQMANLGTDATADVESAVNQVNTVRAEFAALRKGLSEEAAVRRAEEFAARIKNFYEKNQIE